MFPPAGPNKFDLSMRSGKYRQTCLQPRRAPLDHALSTAVFYYPMYCCCPMYDLRISMLQMPFDTGFPNSCEKHPPHKCDLFNFAGT